MNNGHLVTIAYSTFSIEEVLPQKAPDFLGEATSEEKIYLDSTSESTSIELPEIFDVNSDSYNVTLTGDTGYFSYDSDFNSILLDNKKASSEITEETVIEVTITIEDSKGYSSSHTISITIIPEEDKPD